ncbi:MAG TPA: hypothetical protein VMV92_01195 [Streptosporangiaceae bacterium]|nr:hypothetical protein [Streptosporangiaceae bacterium]
MLRAHQHDSDRDGQHYQGRRQGQDHRPRAWAEAPPPGSQGQRPDRLRTPRLILRLPQQRAGARRTRVTATWCSIRVREVSPVAVAKHRPVLSPVCWHRHRAGRDARAAQRRAAAAPPPGALERQQSRQSGQQ